MKNRVFMKLLVKISKEGGKIPMVFIAGLYRIRRKVGRNSRQIRFYYHSLNQLFIIGTSSSVIHLLTLVTTVSHLDLTNLAITKEKIQKQSGRNKALKDTLDDFIPTIDASHNNKSKYFSTQCPHSYKYNFILHAYMYMCTCLLNEHTI